MQLLFCLFEVESLHAFETLKRNHSTNDCCCILYFSMYGLRMRIVKVRMLDFLRKVREVSDRIVDHDELDWLT